MSKWRISNLIAFGLLVCAVVSTRATAQYAADDNPVEFEGVGVVEKLDAQLPLDLEFVDEHGKKVKLGDYFKPGRPVILTLNYYRCPMLCTLTLNGLVKSLNKLDWTAGNEFEIVTVSIDPNEEPELAQVKKRHYLSFYDREGVDKGWHFLTGNQSEIETLANSIGFGYRYDESSGEYAHASSIQFVTPSGRVSRYFNDIEFDPRDTKLALIESSEGAIGSPFERMALRCFYYDPDSKSYKFSAMAAVKIGGVVTVVLILIGLFILKLIGPAKNNGGGNQGSPASQPSVRGIDRPASKQMDAFNGSGETSQGGVT
ncbi:MAG: SCO family protein [Phycisphaerales bacterium]|nr:SCO family protein [Phycisphaerales bacterium]